MSYQDLELALPEVLRAFYARVRQDDQLGPIFNSAVYDWDEHLERIADFWSSVLLGTGRYKGNPVARHLPHAAQINRAKFDRWLELWRETTSLMLPAEVAAGLQTKAERIAESLILAMQFPSPAQRTMMGKDGG
ncbi:group III truncated hemoglobin [Sphingobium tyrosinilyticum]|uniref:Group III truncated hemoglobin n=1 Tax=Sphingobium tyrosinilyticum TaxID=2715436 RepID=A0ABV9EZG5_9SPHN